MLREVIRAELLPHFEEMRRFVDRRIAEVSAEVNGATQLLGFAEENLSGQLCRLHDQVGRVVASSAEGGVELEAMVQTTRAAAHQIMAAAEAINDAVRGLVPDGSMVRKTSIHAEAGFEACAMQDSTAQRLRRAIRYLQHMESTLIGILAPDEERDVFQPVSPSADASIADMANRLETDCFSRFPRLG